MTVAYLNIVSHSLILMLFVCNLCAEKIFDRVISFVDLVNVTSGDKLVFDKEAIF